MLGWCLPIYSVNNLFVFIIVNDYQDDSNNQQNYIDCSSPSSLPPTPPHIEARYQELMKAKKEFNEKST